MTTIKLKLFAACSDGGDGSVSVTLVNSREEALEHLDRTEEELEEGCFHDDGSIEKVNVTLIEDEGKWILKDSVTISAE